MTVAFLVVVVVFCILFLLIDLNYSLDPSKSISTGELTSLYYSSSKTLSIINPCQIEQSIRIRNHSLYQFDRKDQQWKQLYISAKFSPKQIPIVSSIVYFNDDLIFIINGQLCRTQDFLTSQTEQAMIYRLRCYFNEKLPILSTKIDSAFATPCCNCLQMISKVFNDLIILTNRSGHVILFNIKSLTIMYDFGEIFQNYLICQSNPCTIHFLGLIHSQPILFGVIQYQSGKAIVFHQPFLNFNSTSNKSNQLDFIGDILYITPSIIPNAYFLWNDRQIFYTPNAGAIVVEILPNGCEKSHFNVDQVNFTTDIFCYNFTIESLFISKQELVISTKDHGWFYGRESISPSIIPVNSSCISIEFLPQINFQCLFPIEKNPYPCSSFIQSTCSYTRFQALFNLNEIYRLEKNQHKTWQFLLETYTIIPLMIISPKTTLFHYTIDYQIDRLKTGLIQIIGIISLMTTISNQTDDHLFDSNMITLRVELLQSSYACQDMSSFSFQVEASCSTASVLWLNKYRTRNHTFDWIFPMISRTDEIDESDSLKEIAWFREKFPMNFHPIYIKRKQFDPIFLNYQYCLNNTCQTLNSSYLTSFLIYAIPFNRKHEESARYLFNRTDSCIPIQRITYRLWLQWTLNRTMHAQFFQIPYQRRTFYQRLLNLLFISPKSCLFFNASQPIQINQTGENGKYLVHIIAYKNSFSFCDLETFFILELASLSSSKYSPRGWFFFPTIIFFLVLFLLVISLYACYEKFQHDRFLQYHCLNHIDAGQFHQWYDLAQYLNTTKNSENYTFMQTYLSNFKPRKP